MNLKKANLKLGLLVTFAIVAAAFFLLYGLRFDRVRLLRYMLSVRLPKILVIFMVAYSIGTASIVFQTITNNQIITPGILGMDKLYSLIHTSAYFFLGAGSIYAVNARLAYLVDIALMGFLSLLIYGYFFKKTGHNVLYILLIGTILSSLFASLQSSLTRIMDPNEYDALYARLIPSFNKMRQSVIIICFIILVLGAIYVRKEIRMLDVLALGKAKAINLGIDYDKAIRKLLIVVSIYIASSTALVGPLSFLGLIIANIARQSFKTYRHSYLMLGASLIGAIVLFVSETAIERIFHYGMPVSTVITIAGGIYFVYLLIKERKAL